MNDTILVDIKKMFGIHPDDTGFDQELEADIQSVLMILEQLGVVKKSGFSSDMAWDDLEINLDDYGSVRSYVRLKIRQIFDPPQSSYALNAIIDQCKELEWRLTEKAEEVKKQNGKL